MGAALDSFDPSKLGLPAPPAAAPPPDPNGSPLDPNWKASGNPLWDFITRPRAKTEGVGEAARDWGLSAADAATFGQVNRVAPQSLIDQAHQNMGTLDPVAQGLGYAIGPGKILGPIARGAVRAGGFAADAGAPLLARIGSSVAAGGLEGAGAGGLGAAGHGGDTGDIVKGTVEGGIVGALGGTAGGSGPVPKAPEVGEAFPATGMYAAKNAEYAPLDQIYYPRPIAAVNAAAQQLRNARDPLGMGVSLGVPQEVKQTVGDLLKTPVVTGRNIQEASAALRDNGHVTAHRVADNLDRILANDQPLAGGAPGDAAKAQKAGDTIWGQIKDLNRLDDPTPAAVKTTRSFYNDGTPQANALDALSKAQLGRFNPYLVRHAVMPLAFEGAAQAENYLDPNKENRTTVGPMLHALAAGSLFGGLHAAARPRIGSALNEARYAIGTGQPISTGGQRVGDFLLNGLLGQQSGER